MRIRINRQSESIITLLILMSMATLLSGCAEGVSLLNRTNQSSDYPNSYFEDGDRYVGGKPYEFKLQVRREYSRVPYSSIKPYVIIDGERHEMTMAEDWEQRKSLWTYQTTEDCPGVGFGDYYGFKYSFSVDYDRESDFISQLFVKSPPARIPSSGEYHSRVFGAGRFHFAPSAATYDPQCWDANSWDTSICLPTWRADQTYTAGHPGGSAAFEYTLTLRNLSQDDVHLMFVRLANVGANPPNDNFELVGLQDLPETISCEQTFGFKIRYKPGFYQDPDYIGWPSVTEEGMIQTWVRGPQGQSIFGPRIYIDYVVSEEAQ